MKAVWLEHSDEGGRLRQNELRKVSRDQILRSYRPQQEAS